MDPPGRTAAGGGQVSLPLVMLALANAALFALGAWWHAGLPFGEIAEPLRLVTTVLEAAAALLLLGAGAGTLLSAPWAFRHAAFAHCFALVVVLASGMLLALDHAPSSPSFRTMQILRVVFAGLCLVLVSQSARATVPDRFS